MTDTTETIEVEVEQLKDVLYAAEIQLNDMPFGIEDDGIDEINQSYNELMRQLSDHNSAETEN